jgi:hypothetical protein
MKLWLLEQSFNDGYDTYDSAVVSAMTEEDARNVYVASYSTWASPEHVKATLIGTAIRGTKAGDIICASFNAG